MNRLTRYNFNKAWQSKRDWLEIIRQENEPKLIRLRFWDETGETSRRSELGGIYAALPYDTMKRLTD
jgi:hypothetical protein